MYIEKVKHVRFDNKKDYQREIKKTILELENWDMSYNIIESRYNSEDNGYKAEISYGFWADNYDY